MLLQLHGSDCLTKMESIWHISAVSMTWCCLTIISICSCSSGCIGISMHAAWTYITLRFTLRTFISYRYMKRLALRLYHKRETLEIWMSEHKINYFRFGFTTYKNPTPTFNCDRYWNKPLYYQIHQPLLDSVIHVHILPHVQNIKEFIWQIVFKICKLRK